MTCRCQSSVVSETILTIGAKTEVCLPECYALKRICSRRIVTTTGDLVDVDPIVRNLAYSAKIVAVATQTTQTYLRYSIHTSLPFVMWN